MAPLSESSAYSKQKANESEGKWGDLCAPEVRVPSASPHVHDDCEALDKGMWELSAKLP